MGEPLDKALDFAIKVGDRVKPRHVVGASLVAGVLVALPAPLLEQAGVAGTMIAARASVAAVIWSLCLVLGASWLVGAGYQAATRKITESQRKAAEAQFEVQIETWLQARFRNLSGRERELLSDCLRRHSPTIALPPLMLPDVAALVTDQIIRRVDETSTERWAAYVIEPRVWEFIRRNAPLLGKS